MYLSVSLKQFIGNNDLRYIATHLFLPIMGKEGITKTHLEELIASPQVPCSPESLNQVIGLLKRHKIISDGGKGADGLTYQYFIDWEFFEDYLRNVKRDERGMIII